MSALLVFGLDQATGQTLALLATFVGIGIFVTLLVGYIIAQILVERRQNREYRVRGG